MLATAYLKSPASQEPGSAVALFGPERFLKRLAIDALCRQVLGPDAGDESLVRLRGDTADFATVVDRLLTISMWNPRQVVVVEDADAFVSDHRDGLEKYLDRPARKSVLVLDVKSWPSNTRLAKKVAKVGLPIECASLKPNELVGWLVAWCQAHHGKKIDHQAAQTLTELAGTELGTLDQELAKLASFVGDGATIDSAAVEALVGGWKAETTWSMIDAVRDNRLGEALHLLDKLLRAGEHPLRLLGGINSTYRALARGTELARLGTPLIEALTSGGVKPWQVNQYAGYLRRIGRPRAERLLSMLMHADMDVKGHSQLPDRLIMERLLLQLGGNCAE
jgi:DNA polymerase-3 subunit delta